MDDDKIREQLNLPPENPVTEPVQVVQPVQQPLNNIEQVPMESQYEEPKKRKLRKGTIPKLILSVILFVAGVSLIIWSINYEEPEENPTENNTTVIDDNQTQTDAFVGLYYLSKEVAAANNTDTDVTDEAYILRTDGTFVYVKDTTAEHPTAKVGRYTISNGTITLEEVVSYGSDTCFYTKDDKDIVFNTYNATINEQELVLNNGMKDIIYTKSYDTNNIQGRFSETWYVIEPIDGASPDNSTSVDHWTKCDNLEN